MLFPIFHLDLSPGTALQGKEQGLLNQITFALTAFALAG